MDKKVYDIIILGGGPAGYTAALYATRSGFDTLILEKLSAGGQMTETAQIDNYPGFPEGIDGFTLGFNMQSGAERFGAKTVNSEVLSVDLNSTPKLIRTDSGEYYALAVIVATGANHRHLGLDNEEKLIGKGLGYCATCDGMFYKGKTVAVVGGGNSAAADALYLSKICSKVYLIHRRDSLRATKIYHEPLLKTENVEFIWNSKVNELLFEDKLNGIVIENIKDGNISRLSLDGFFISIGRSPETEIFISQLEIDEFGYIKADETTKTNIDGVFAAGDVRTKALRQVITAAADGAVAASFAEQYLNSLK